MLNKRHSLFLVLLMLLSTAQSVSAMAEFCAPNEHDNAALFGLAFPPNNDRPQNEQSGPDQAQFEENAHADECVDCSDCQCCAHFALTRLSVTARFLAPITRFITHAPDKPSSKYARLLRPPRV